MKKFVFLYQGAWLPPTQEMKDAWTGWFSEIEDNIMDSGNPFGEGREVSESGTRDLPLEPDSTVGYTIVEAASMDDAEKLLANCPIITSVRIYEAMSM